VLPHRMGHHDRFRRRGSMTVMGALPHGRHRPTSTPGGACTGEPGDPRRTPVSSRREYVSAFRWI
jgi:hypothetical protein